MFLSRHVDPLRHNKFGAERGAESKESNCPLTPQIHMDVSGQISRSHFPEKSPNGGSSTDAAAYSVTKPRVIIRRAVGMQ